MTEALEERPVIVTSSVVIPQQSLVVPRESDADREARRNNAATAKRYRQGPQGSNDWMNPDAEPASAEPKKPRLTLEDNPEFKARGQRLFGIILGTLHRSGTDNAKKSKMAEKREETERRLQERLAKEKEEIAQKIKEEREAKIARIEKEREEIRIRSAADAREAKRSQLREASNFLITSCAASPPLYYLPFRHVDRTQEKLAEQSRKAAGELAVIEAEEEKDRELASASAAAPASACQGEPSEEAGGHMQPVAGNDEREVDAGMQEQVAGEEAGEGDNTCKDENGKVGEDVRDDGNGDRNEA